MLLLYSMATPRASKRVQAQYNFDVSADTAIHIDEPIFHPYILYFLLSNHFVSVLLIVNQSINQSANQSINQSNNQSINQSNKQSVNQ